MIPSYDCLESGHVWEAVETYQVNENEIGVIRKCFECDKEFTEYEVI
jgi:hypothetical protein